MALVYRDPFEQLQAELERMLDAAFGPAGPSRLYPPVNVFDAGDAYVVKAEVPGVSPDKIDIDVEDDTLTLRGERAFSEPNRGAARRRRGRAPASSRRWTSSRPRTSWCWSPTCRASRPTGSTSTWRATSSRSRAACAPASTTA